MQSVTAYSTAAQSSPNPSLSTTMLKLLSASASTWVLCTTLQTLMGIEALRKKYAQANQTLLYSIPPLVWAWMKNPTCTQSHTNTLKNTASAATASTAPATALFPKETIKFAGLDPENAKVIVCHVGNGASVSASIGGKCVDTSMGLTPLEGLIMGTRSGDLDPAVIQYICNKENKTVDEVLNMLNKKSGLLGMSGGLSSDCRDITAAAEEGHHLAKVTLDAYTYRIAKYVGAYAAAMNGVDAIAFTAGVGENDIEIREELCEKYWGYLGVKIDKEANHTRGENKLISAADSKVKVLVIPTNEELANARDTLALI